MKPSTKSTNDMNLFCGEESIKASSLTSEYHSHYHVNIPKEKGSDIKFTFITLQMAEVLSTHSNLHLNWKSIDTQVRFLWTETLNYFRYICLKLRLLMFTALMLVAY